MVTNELTNYFRGRAPVIYGLKMRNFFYKLIYGANCSYRCLDDIVWNPRKSGIGGRRGARVKSRDHEKMRKHLFFQI